MSPTEQRWAIAVALACLIIITVCLVILVDQAKG